MNNKVIIFILRSKNRADFARFLVSESKKGVQGDQFRTKSTG